MVYIVGLMNNVIGKPAIFLRGRYVASDLCYLKNIDTFTYRVLNIRRSARIEFGNKI